MKGCPWCTAIASDDVDPDRLCRGHLAEYEGLTPDELDRMDDEQARDLL